MITLQNVLLNWVKELEQHRSPEWSTLPDIDLYMDQVITYLERQMSSFSLSVEEKLITPAMINNYVKNGIIPRPIQKKYTREHMSHLMAVLNLKQVLSLSDIKKIINLETMDKTTQVLYDQFNAMQSEALLNTSARVREVLEKLDTDPGDEKIERRLRLLALKLSLEANANRIAAKRILDEIVARRTKDQEKKEKEKDKDKNKDRDKDIKNKEDRNKGESCQALNS